MMAYREIGTGGSISWMYVGNAIRMVRRVHLPLQIIIRELTRRQSPKIWGFIGIQPCGKTQIVSGTCLQLRYKSGA
jgi:hypothetical protein